MKKLKKVITDYSRKNIDELNNWYSWREINKDFKLHNLAIALDVPDHHLASCLRNIRETTFTDLKNLYRINAFKDRIENGAFNTLTIDALREECGFQSKSSFFSAFQKQEGMTPMAYISKK
jgi:AraC-like DNA-binding protein